MGSFLNKIVSSFPKKKVINRLNLLPFTRKKSRGTEKKRKIRMNENKKRKLDFKIRKLAGNCVKRMKAILLNLFL